MPKNNYDDDDDDLLMALQSMEPCGNCGAEGAKIPCMSGCGEVFYCSRECNMHHASAHRLRCRNLRCSKFNDDSESEASESEYEEFTDDSDEYETDSGDDDDDEEEEEEEEKPKKKKKGKGGKGKRKMTRAESVDASRMVVDSEVERRIEEKIMRRLKKQEENRIAQAIEQRMREEKANWKDEEMNRIIMEMRERFQKEIANSEFMAQFIRNNAQSLEAQSSADMLQSIQAAAAAAAAAAAGGTAQGDNPQAEGKESPLASSYGPGNGAAGAVIVAGGDDAESRARSVSKESSWNNSCRAFEALRVVIWKHSFLPRMKFGRHPGTGIWNAITEIDGDESFSHISEGDALVSINGRCIDEAVQTEEDLMDIFAAFASPLIFKFEAADPYNGKVHDYTVTWSNGPLGVTLKDDCTNQKVPIVNRLTKKTGSVAVKQNIAIGDILVAINNIDTIQLGCSLSMSILKKVQLPAKLKFRGVGGPTAGGSGAGDNDAAGETGKFGTSDSISSTRPATYIVNWGEGPLGLTIIPGMEEYDLPVIKKVTGTGTSVGIEHAQVGDFLETMNDISTEGMPFEDVVSYLKSAPKPVLLKFRSATGDDGEIMVSVPPPPPVMEIKRTPSAQMSASTSSTRSSPAPSPPKSYTAAPQQTYSAPAPAPATVPVPVPAAEIVRDEYKVVWGDGPLGLTIDAREDAPTGAYIKRIASQGAASRLSQDCIGDFLTHINDMDVSRVAFQDIVSQLKSSPRPLTLYFKRRSAVIKGSFAQSSSSVPVVSSAPHQARPRMSDTPTRGRKPSAHEEAGIHYYNVVWQDGTPLGLSLRGADNTSDYPYITRVTGNGSAAHLPNSVVGDCLVSVDGRSVHVRDKTFDEVMTMLKNMPKPVTLKFQARTDDQPRGGSSSGMHVPPMQQHQQYQQQQQQPPAPFQASQSHTWRQNRGGAPLPTASSMPAPGGPQFASSLVRQQSHQISRSHMGPSDRALDIAAGQEDKFANIQSPFLVQNKLSTGRRQKMLKGLKK